MRSLVYYVATSMDGFIADPTGDFSAFPQRPETLRALFERYPETCPAHVRDALGVHAAPTRFDTVLMGYRTFLPALQAGLTGGAYPHLHQIVVTHRQIALEGVRTLTGDISAQVAELKRQPGRDLWLCGGGDLAGQLIEEIDELELKVNPVLLGEGIPLLRRPSDQRSFDLAGSERLPGGVLLNRYRRS